MLTRLMGVVLAVLLLAGGTLAAEPPAKRLPVPEAAAREKALVTIRDVFKSELAKAKTPAELSALSEKLAKTAAETKDDPVARFVLWQLAVEQATKAGDLKTAFAAIDDMTANYELDDLTVKSRTFVGLVPQLTSKTFRDPLVTASGLIGRAVGADRYDSAKAISEQTNALAQKFGDPALKKEILAQKAEVERLEKAYADVPAANKLLETNATDPAANILVGKYQIEKGNWEAAMSYLALSGDPLYKDIAAKELAQPKEVAERLAIADGWWAVAEADKTPLKAHFQARAAEFYNLALSGAAGLTKKKIESRLSDAAKIPKSPLSIAAPEDVKKPVAAVPKSITNKIGMKFNLIPAGEFLMGSPESELGYDNKRQTDEKVHRVKITKPFYLGVYDVTRGQFAKFVADQNYKTDAEKDGKGSYGCDARGDFARKAEYTWRSPGLYGNKQTDDHPVVCVSWNDAQGYCDWLIKKEGKKYRLPTEAEWEYACRAETTSLFYFGNSLNGDNANCNGERPYGTATKGAYLKCTTPVGWYKPNPFGLYDMHGNVKQWCEDWYDKDYYANSPSDNPQGPAAGSVRVLRGGGWFDLAVRCRSANRHNYEPADSDNHSGFRVVLDISDNAGSGANGANAAQSTTKPPTTNKPEAAGKLQFTKWVYPADETGLTGYFQQDATGWIEVKDGRPYARFKETNRTADYIEILDEGRRMWVRIGATQASWSRDKSNWSLSARGSPAVDK